MIFRIPIRPGVAAAVEWIEQKGPKCIRANMLAGAMLSGPSSIDFVLRNRSRVRAVMDDECPALDFYRGFYLQPDDDYVCAKRETIRSGSGEPAGSKSSGRWCPTISRPTAKPSARA